MVLIWKLCFLFYLGGMCYQGLELLWRGFSHGSMFVLGGIWFVMVGNLKRLRPGKKLPARVTAAALIITLLELGCGLLVNRSYRVWDYRNMPLNVFGQICLPFTLLWIPVSFVAMLLYDWTNRGISQYLYRD